MNERPASKSASTTVIAVICVIALLLLGGLAVFGIGGFFMYRQQSVRAQAEAMSAREIAEVARQAEMASRRAAETLLAEVRAQAAADNSPAAMVELVLSAGGSISLDDQSIALEELGDALKNRAANIRKIEILIQADPQCPFAEVVKVQNECVQLGIERIRFAAHAESNADG